jgi:hypothetical protein
LGPELHDKSLKGVIIHAEQAAGLHQLAGG